jgi:hypothetical protein
MLSLANVVNETVSQVGQSIDLIGGLIGIVRTISYSVVKLSDAVLHTLMRIYDQEEIHVSNDIELLRLIQDLTESCHGSEHRNATDDSKARLQVVLARRQAKLEVIKADPNRHNLRDILKKQRAKKKLEHGV